MPSEKQMKMMPATRPYVDRLVLIFRDNPYDDRSAIVLQDYALAALAAAENERLRRRAMTDRCECTRDALEAEIETLRAEVERLRTDGASAVRWAPSSVYWSDVLRELFGPDARVGIDTMEARRLAELERANTAEAMLRQTLEQIEQQFDYGQIDMALHIARRALEGLFGTLSGSDK